MKKRGFRWNAKSRSWVKGDMARAQRLECRSGSRVLCWNGDQSAMPPDALTAIRQATTRFEAALREAREAALGDREADRRMQLQVKDRIAKPYAPFVWLAVQLITAASLVSVASTLTATNDVFADTAAVSSPSAPPLLVPVAIGIAFAPLLSALRRERWRRQPGVEDGEGALERILVDAQLGSYALPAPWEWRAAEPLRWGAFTWAAESLASVNMALFWHGCVQQAIHTSTAPTIGDAPAALLSVLAVAASAAARCQYFYDEVRDGLPAEVAAASRMNASASTYYYTMTSTSAAEADIATAAIGALTGAWSAKFAAAAEDDAEARFSQLTLTFVQAAVCGLLWELCGRSVVAPALALAGAAADVYVLRPDTELSRAVLPLDSLTLPAQQVVDSSGGPSE